MKGCLAIIGGIVVFLFVIVACAGMNSASSGGGSSQFQSSDSNAASSDVVRALDDTCNKSLTHQNQSMRDYDAGDYSGGYKNAATAVALSGSCSDSDLPYVKGFALSAKAVNEHHLAQGDSATDMNQAETLLANCQTQPGYYGTHKGAECETEEENDISTKQNWEMAQYDQ